MVTYLYWTLIIGLAIVAILVGVRFNRMLLGLLLAAILMMIGWTAYHFYFQQIFV